ncbi:hypothetical protein RFZ45_10295, partial [Acinetobacter baumannii]|nr:hypothetical protein [Acinetobacter baumannii]
MMIWDKTICFPIAGGGIIVADDSKWSIPRAPLRPGLCGLCQQGGAGSGVAQGNGNGIGSIVGLWGGLQMEQALG